MPHDLAGELAQSGAEHEVEWGKWLDDARYATTEAGDVERL
jgi:hypothetical protein